MTNKRKMPWMGITLVAGLLIAGIGGGLSTRYTWFHHKSTSVSQPVKKMDSKHQDSYIHSLDQMVSMGYRPTEVEKEINSKIMQLDKTHSTQAVADLMKSIQSNRDYFNQLLSVMYGEIQYTEVVDHIKDPVKDQEKLSNQLVKGYFAEMKRQHILVTPTKDSFFLQPDASYVLNKYGHDISGDYKDYLNLLAKEIKDPTFDAKNQMYDPNRLAEDILYIENNRNLWENGVYASEWSSLEKDLYGMFFNVEQGTFYDEKVENAGTAKETTTYTLKSDIIKTYETIAADNPDTEFAKQIDDYLTKMKANHYQQSDKVDQYVNTIIKAKFGTTTNGN